MATKERINPKTGKKEYKVRYYYYIDGKKKDSETGWFNSISEANKEAEYLKAKKEQQAEEEFINKRASTIKQALEAYISDLEKKYTEEREKQKSEISRSNTGNTIHGRIMVVKTLRNLYTPEKIAKIRMRDIKPNDFKEWMAYINDSKTIGGCAARTYRSNLNKFNNWLNDNGYYEDEYLYSYILLSMKNVKLKPSTEHNKEIAKLRNVVSIVDMEKIAEYFEKDGLEKFRNFYYYMFFYLLFYSGMRKEEIVALQWKNINLRSDKKTITICNAISRLEGKIDAMERIRVNNNKVKTEHSIRIIPIFDFYYQMLIDYKECFKYQYNITDEEVEESFLFPVSFTKNSNVYSDTKKYYKVLKEATEAQGIPHTDLQMFRHSCATFLVMPPPEGLGMEERQVYDYFGHKDAQMLKSVYAKLDEYNKSKRLQLRFADIYHVQQIEQDEKTKMYQSIIDRMKNYNPKYLETRKERIRNQIKAAIEKKQKQYYYLEKDKDIIEQWKNDSPMEKDNIKFVMA